MENTPITGAEFVQLHQDILQMLDFNDSSIPLSPVEVMHSSQASSTESDIVAQQGRSACIVSPFTINLEQT